MTDAANSQRKIRVLIVDDIPETRESLRKLLYFEGDVEVVGTATSGEEAVRQAKDARPDIILMDINMPGMDGMAATEIIMKRCAFAHVIMMSVQADGESVRRCMLAGARDFLVKPFTSDELAASIRRIYEVESGRRASYNGIAALPKAPEAAPGREDKQGKLIVVFGPKGGAGSSTIAVNLAVALQKPGLREVALVDANLQFGDVAALLNLHPNRSASDLVPQIRDLDTQLLGAVLASHASGVKALLAPNSLEASDLVTPEHMEAILRQLQRMFDYIIVDTKGFLYDLVLKVLEISDRVLLIATPDIPALKSVRQFLSFIELQADGDERYFLIINMADRPGAIEAADIEESLNLLQTAIGYWDALKNTTPDGLRDTFLRRSGKISRRDNDWLVQVERQSFDILLDDLPWGISVVQFPWMRELVWVEW